MHSTGYEEREAKLHYAGGDYQVVVPGSYVTCAVTGEHIPLDELRYWSFTRQEAYVSCQVSYERELACNPGLRKLLDRTAQAEHSGFSRQATR